MSEHKFKVGDDVAIYAKFVRTTEGDILLNVDGNLHCVPGVWVHPALTKPPAVEVMEKLLLEAYVQIVRLEPFAPPAPDKVLGVAKERLQRAYRAALTSAEQSTPDKGEGK